MKLKYSQFIHYKKLDKLIFFNFQDGYTGYSFKTLK